MSTEEIVEAHQEGPPWKIVGRFPTFEKADSKREQLLVEEDIQVKIHWQGTAANRYYAVKARVDPAIAREEAILARRAEKKRRKARLNKKRRKK